MPTVGPVVWPYGVTGKTWEELVVSRIFDPLNLTSAGFGPQSSLGRVDAPLGHAAGKDGKMQSFLAGPWGDNPLVIGPAGWRTCPSSTSRPGRRECRPRPLRAAARQARDDRQAADEGRRHAAEAGRAGRHAVVGWLRPGWGTVSLPFAPEPLVFHGGSNNMNLAYIVLQPKQEFGLMTMTNISGPKANEALMAITELLFKRLG